MRAFVRVLPALFGIWLLSSALPSSEAEAAGSETCSAVESYQEHFVQRQKNAVERLVNYRGNSGVSSSKRLEGGEGAFTALLTYPNSGTTWVRSLYEMATTIASESVYLEPPCEILPEWRTCASVQKGAGRTQDRKKNEIVNLRLRKDKEPALVKTHHAITENHRFDRVVRIIRNPIDNVVANFNYLFQNYWLKPRGAKRFEISFHRFLRDQMRLYVRWHCRGSREASRTPTLTIAYEDLVENPLDSMVEILTFTGWNVDAEMTRRLKDGVKKFPPRSREVPRDVPMYLSYFNGSKFLTKRAIEILEEEIEGMERKNECTHLRKDIYENEERSSLVFYYSVFECPECNFSLQKQNALVSEGRQVLARDPSLRDVYRAVWYLSCSSANYLNTAEIQKCNAAFGNYFTK